MFRTIDGVRTPGLRALLGIAIGLFVSDLALAGVNRWTSGGPWAGGVTAIVVNPSNPQVVYAAAQFAGIFRSRDGGVSWQEINNGLLDSWITGLAIDPSNPSTLFASSYGFFVYRSTDGGDHWVSQYVNDPTSSYGMASAIAIDPLAPSTVYVATLNGIWKTTDGGCSWGPSNGDLPAGPHEVGSVVASPTEEGVVFAFLSFQATLYRSSDGGGTWAAVLPLGTDHSVRQVALDQTDRSIAFAAASSFDEITGESGGGVYRSTDGGLTWNAIATLPDEPFSGASIDRFDGSIFVSSSGGVRVSTDSGATWSAKNDGLPSAGGLVQGTVAGLWWCSGGGGVYETLDSGNHWFDVSTGISGVIYGRVVIDPTNESTLWCSNSWGGGKSVFRSNDGGASWANTSTGLGTGGVGPLVAMPGTPLTLFAAGNSHTIYRSTDMGDTWAAAGSLDDTATPGIGALVVPPTNPGRLYAVAGPLFYSDNQGVSWAPASPDPHFLDFVAADVEVDGSLFGTVDGIVQRSADSGATWTPSNVGLETALVNSITQDPAAPDHMLAAVQGDAVAMTVPVYQSLDRGATWTPSSAGLPQKINGGSIVFDPLVSTTVYLSAYAFVSPTADVAHPVYRSLDGGATWAPYDRGLPPRRPDSAQITAASDGSIYFEGLGGVFEIHASATPPPSIESVAPASGPAAGDSLVIVSGSGFANATGLLFGDAPAADFAVVDDARIAAITPAGIAGAVSLTVVTDEPQLGKVERAFVYDFSDLPRGSLFHDSVVALALRAVTGGCGAGNFCPNAPLNRGQAAVQIEKAVRGADYPFDPVFGGPNANLSMADVDRCSGFGPYVQQFLFDQITAGCGYPNYCPGNPVTRAQMMVFLLRAEHGPAYIPPPATGTVFNDVPADSFAADYIEAAAQEGITGGCGGGNFCPGNAVTRGQAAALIFNTFPSAP